MTQPDNLTSNSLLSRLHQALHIAMKHFRHDDECSFSSYGSDGTRACGCGKTQDRSRIAALFSDDEWKAIHAGRAPANEPRPAVQRMDDDGDPFNAGYNRALDDVRASAPQPPNRHTGFEPSPVIADRLQEVGWLIERNNVVPEYAYFDKTGCFSWTRDANEALRFARRVDAEMLAADNHEDWKAVEHMWVRFPDDMSMAESHGDPRITGQPPKPSAPLWLAQAFEGRAQHEPNCSWSREACACTCGLFELRLHLANILTDAERSTQTKGAAT